MRSIEASRLVEQAMASCRSGLDAPDVREIGTRIRRAGIADSDLVARVAATSEGEQGELEAIVEAIGGRDTLAEGAALERYLLLRAAHARIPELANLRLTDEVRALFVDAVRFYADPDTPHRGGFVFRIGHPHFGAMCRVVSLARFPAGQFDFTTAGFLRSWLFRIEKRHLIRALRTLAFELRGFRPMFTVHYSVCRKARLALSEAEVTAAYARIARVMALQPEVRGFVAASWFFCPDTHRVSPHLAWLNDVFRGNGALLSTVGPAGAESGVFTGSPRRRELFESGVYRPMMGLVVWPRRAMLEWERRAA